MRVRSSRSSMSRASSSTLRRIISMAARRSSGRSPLSSSAWTVLSTGVKGVRSSCESMARNRSFAWLAASAASRAFLRIGVEQGVIHGESRTASDFLGQGDFRRAVGAPGADHEQRDRSQRTPPCHEGNNRISRDGLFTQNQRGVPASTRPRPARHRTDPSSPPVSRCSEPWE